MRSTVHHFVLFVIFLAIFGGVLATRKALPDPTAFVLVVATFMAVVWQGIYLGAIVRTDVRNVRPFPTEPVRAPKGTVTTDWGGAEYIGRLAAAGVLDDAERMLDDRIRDESRPYDWANEEAA